MAVTTVSGAKNAGSLGMKSLLHAYGGWGYDHVLTHIVPMLDEVGVTTTQIETMLKYNPARWLDVSN